ncbi:efflux RND transporter permease subunit [Telmatospirillum siberiense]|uniref:Nodulation protein n=1 Tax=Telmatospirillum siberiense TaxID=382514 RepID=A0A2N3PUN6_9PROT|nr:efflux RND transporter permease subunit [Telmatospirillum siberiense]PKU24107.1 nodulation protein [Telmatospirillum siberiense]
MNPVAFFVGRPVATTLLTAGIALAGMVSYFFLPVAPLPQVDIPTIVVYAYVPGASAETMAATVATPLERHLGRIADVDDMSSQSNVGSTNVILPFGLSRSIDGAARDVQAAINAARADLPGSLKSNPGYWKISPTDIPILLLSLDSATLTPEQLFDSAASVIQQKLSQVEGVGQVKVAGSALPAVRVELNPHALFKYGIGVEDIRAALASANANAPKGALEDGRRRLQIYTNDQARTAAEYRSLIVAFRSGRAVRLSDVAEVLDSVEDLRNMGLTNGQRAVVIQVNRQPGANIIATADRVKAALPELRASLPADVSMDIVLDLTTTIRASVDEVQKTLLISLGLVILVVFVFLGDARAALIPAVAVPVSIVGTFAVMRLLDYSLNNLTLIALTVSTGFVVDDAVVVLENVIRHMEGGMTRRRAALQGAREVAFTVLSMSLSLIAVFIPILFMGGLAGRFLNSFSITLSAAILMSLVISLTTTPMMCATLLRTRSAPGRSRLARANGRLFERLSDGYARSLSLALRHPGATMLLLLATVGLNFYLYAIVPKGFIPQQDTGSLTGGIKGDQSISFQAMSGKLKAFQDIVRGDPDVAAVVGFTGGGTAGNAGKIWVSLKPLAERSATADAIIARLRPQFDQVAGASLYLQSNQLVGGGGVGGNAQYQYSLLADDMGVLKIWTDRLADAMRAVPFLADVTTDLDNGGLQADLEIDRATAARLGLQMSQIDDTLYDAFGQRQVSTIFNPLNQYHVVMEVAPQYWQDPKTLSEIFISTSAGAVSGTDATNALAGTTGSTKTQAQVTADGARNRATNAIGSVGRTSASTGSAVSTSAETMIPLSAIAHFGQSKTPLSVNHRGHYASATVSFNLTEGKSLSDATAAIEEIRRQIHIPETVRGEFAGTAKYFQQGKSATPILILAALASIYIVLGILYESYIHPITILSTLPSAGIGALLALLVFHIEFSMVAMIGVLLLIGVVKKNAIMMIDFALEAERSRGLSSRDAIYQACLMRFRPIMMTTMVALFGALPLALGKGDGAELRQPLGISIIGGLVVSQILTLYTTPVIYMALDRWSRRRPAIAMNTDPLR